MPLFPCRDSTMPPLPPFASPQESFPPPPPFFPLLAPASSFPVAMLPLAPPCPAGFVLLLILLMDFAPLWRFPFHAPTPLCPSNFSVFFSLAQYSGDVWELFFCFPSSLVPSGSSTPLIDPDRKTGFLEYAYKRPAEKTGVSRAPTFASFLSACLCQGQVFASVTG